MIKLNIQLFAEGEGQGNTEPTPNGGEGNAAPNNGGVTYTQEQIDGIVSERVKRAEKSALKSFFSQQGMSEDEINQAISAYKASKAANTPNVEAIQAELEKAKNEKTAAVVEHYATLEAFKLGVGVEKIPYLLKMADLNDVMNAEGAADTKKISEALGEVLKAVPALKDDVENKNGFRKIGGDGSNGSKPDEGVLAEIFGNKRRE